MSPNVIQVEPIAPFKLRLFFDNGEVKQFDVTPYLDRGVFAALRDPHLFQSVKPFFGGVQWRDEQDLSADTLYCQSEPDQPHHAGDRKDPRLLQQMQRSVLSFD